MRNKKQELDVDFIGGQEPPTKEELLAISAHIKAAKERRSAAKKSAGGKNAKTKKSRAIA